MLVQIVEHMMAKDPDQRYPDCGAVLADLHKLSPLPLGEGQGVRAAVGQNLPVIAQLATVSAAPRQRMRDWAATLFRRYIPEPIQAMQGTTQQMDAAVAHYQRRRDRLAMLLKEAQSLEGGLPREQIEQLQQQLGTADATLAQLRSQQNLLKARLRAADAHRQSEGGSPRPKRSHWLIGAIMVGLAVGAARCVFGIVIAVPGTIDNLTNGRD